MRTSCSIGIALLLSIPGCREKAELPGGFPLAGLAAKMQAIEAKEDAEWKENTITLEKSLALGSLKITPVKVELKEVSGTSHGENFKTDDPVLVLTYTAQNTSEGQVFRPTAFVYGATDDFGNKLDRLFGSSDASAGPGGYTSYRIDGSEEMKELQSGDTATIILALKPKLKTAKVYLWKIYQTIGNQEKGGAKHWGLKCDASAVLSP